MTEMIAVKQVSKSYDRIKAVDEISFSLAKGDILGFLGPNGAGKTTAMKMITGYMPPEKGDIFVKGVNVRENPIVSRNAIGYLPENNPLYLDMTVDEYLSFVADMRAIGDKEKAIKEAAERCAIGNVRHRIIGHLSKGYKQRVGLAQAIIHNPEILILDEPVNGLDPIQITEIRSLIKDLGREKTVILCSHILSEVEAVASRVVIINKGKIAADDTIEGLKDRSQGHTIYRIEFLSSKDEAMLREKVLTISGVSALSRVGGDTYRLKTKGARETGSELIRLAVREQWDLSQVYVESSSLENTFLNLIEGDNA